MDRSEEGRPDPTVAAPSEKLSGLLGWELAHEMRTFFGELQIVKETARMVLHKRTTRAAIAVDWKGFREWHSEKIAGGGSFTRKALCSAWRNWAKEARTSKKVAHQRQEIESADRHSIEIAAKRERAKIEHDQAHRDALAQRDYDDAIAAADEMETRAKRMYARGAGTDLQLAEVIARCQAMRVRAEMKLRSSRGTVGGDDPPATARDIGEQHTHIETTPAAWPALKLAQ